MRPELVDSPRLLDCFRSREPLRRQATTPTTMRRRSAPRSHRSRASWSARILRCGRSRTCSTADRLLGCAQYIKCFGAQPARPTREFADFGSVTRTAAGRRSSSPAARSRRGLPTSLLPATRAVPLRQLLAVRADAEQHPPRVLHANQRVARRGLRGDALAVDAGLPSAFFGIRHSQHAEFATKLIRLHS